MIILRGEEVPRGFGRGGKISITVCMTDDESIMLALACRSESRQIRGMLDMLETDPTCLNDDWTVALQSRADFLEDFANTILGK